MLQQRLTKSFSYDLKVLIVLNISGAVGACFNVSKLKSFISDLENRCKFTLKIAYMQKKLYFCTQFSVFFINFQ